MRNTNNAEREAAGYYVSKNNKNYNNYAEMRSKIAQKSYATCCGCKLCFHFSFVVLLLQAILPKKFADNKKRLVSATNV